MIDVLTETITTHHYLITLNRAQKNNALHPDMILSLHTALHQAIADPNIRVILIKAEGKHFSAGADLDWMQQAIHFNTSENIADAHILSDMLFTLYKSPKPTIALVQGCVYGGGAGLASACDFVIASDSSQFCFPEVKLGLIPAIISPYVIQKIGLKTAKKLFLTAAVFNADDALRFGLVDKKINAQQLLVQGIELANEMIAHPPLALDACKQLVDQVAKETIDKPLVDKTVEWIAAKRASDEAQERLKAFLNKTLTPNPSPACGNGEL